MMSATTITMTLFVVWALFLLVLMEVLRTKLVATKQIAANGFLPDNSNLSPFMQRLARAHANCVEGLPIFGGLMLVAIVTANTSVTDSLAYIFLAARLVQSVTHLVSTAPAAVKLRFSAFAIQMLIACYWSLALVSRFFA